MGELTEWATVATVPSGGAGFAEIEERPVALLIGEEASGLDDRVIESAAHRLTIPMAGPTESLNAAVAAAVMAYEAINQWRRPRSP